MEIPAREEDEELIDYSFRLSLLYSKHNQINYRKKFGQYFTPRDISNYMISLFEIKKNKEISFLDPCSGTGILFASFCQRFCGNPTNERKLKIDLYEIDSTLIPYLEAVVNECKNDLKSFNINYEINLYNKDFILDNASDYFNYNKDEIYQKLKKYDYIVANPPYYKIRKNSSQSNAIYHLIFSQPNIYSLFLSLSILMLSNKGELVFLIPRSFCSGFYYKKVRDFILEKVKIANIHLFKSRSIFTGNVLQETMILKTIKEINNHKQIRISSSFDNPFSNYHKHMVSESKVIFQKNGNKFIRIPLNDIELRVISAVDKFPYILSDLGLQISVGSVVPFRCRESLKNNVQKSSVPLLWMDNINKKSFKIKWPKENSNKSITILNNKKTERLLLPVENYVLIRRFSSKDQDRRIIASIYLKNEFNQFNRIGIENHILYIKKEKYKLTKREVFGLVGYLSTKLIDCYFRTLNGNTQVNKFDINNLPFPSLDALIEIGEYIIANKISSIDYHSELSIAKILNVKEDLITKLYQTS